MKADLAASVVGILKPDRTVAGAGFVVSDDSLIATCAHVVRIAQAEPGDTVDLFFYVTGETRVAEVDSEYWCDPSAQDVAILRLEGALPDEARPLLLGGSRELHGHRFRTFGFPQPRESGMWGYGTVGDLINHPAAGPLLQLSTTEVTPGFSGAPVLDEHTDRAVGMVSEITTQDRYGKLGETAFATPTRILLQACPALQVSEICPYRRLGAFTEADAEFFFGRRRVLKRLLKSLRHQPGFLAVLGPSGSGKSSLVQAGLIPELRKGGVLGSERWGVVITDRYDAPFEQLEAAGLIGAPEGLVDAVEAWLQQHLEHERLVLVLDQFDDLLVNCSKPVRRGFVRQLTKLLDYPCPVTVVIAMQDIFYSRFAQEAPELLQDWLSGGLVQIYRDLEQDELIEIVQKPAEKVGLRFEDGLIGEIVMDAMDTASFEEGEGTARTTILPLLESALTELWVRRRDGMLTRDAYDAIGGLTGGLTQWAERAVKELGGDLRPYARHIFTELVNLGDESQGIRNSRRRRPMDTLYRTGSEGEVIQRVVRRLANARLLVMENNGSDGRESVEIIHDALVHEWGLLRSWLRQAGTREPRGAPKPLPKRPSSLPDERKPRPPFLPDERESNFGRPRGLPD